MCVCACVCIWGREACHVMIQYFITQDDVDMPVLTNSVCKVQFELQLRADTRYDSTCEDIVVNTSHYVYIALHVI